MSLRRSIEQVHAVPSLLVLIVVVLNFAPTASVYAEHPNESAEAWNQWRGPSRNGEFIGPRWPSKLDQFQQTWRVELGPSYSGPIVTENRVYVTETAGKQFEVVRALDRKTGQEIWKTQWRGAMKVPFFASANGSWIRSTPALDDGRLYVGGMVDVLVCIDSQSGQQIWKIDFPNDRGSKKPQFGFASSPLVFGDALYVQAGGAFYKINKFDGSVEWKTLDDGGGMYGSAFASPFIANINGRQQILVQTRQNLTGVDPADGKVLWSQPIPAFRGMNILTPTVYENSIFTSAYGGRSFLYKIENSADQMRPVKLWENRSQAYMSTPVVKDGHAYVHLRNQRFTCIDLSSGKTKWTSEPFGKYSSLVIQGDRILALDQRGDLLMIRATPNEFQLIDSRRISDQETWAHLAASGRNLFVRELNAVTSFEFRP